MHRYHVTLTDLTGMPCQSIKTVFTKQLRIITIHCPIREHVMIFARFHAECSNTLLREIYAVGVIRFDGCPIPNTIAISFAVHVDTVNWPVRVKGLQFIRESLI
jgi:hypothetical protein